MEVTPPSPFITSYFCYNRNQNIRFIRGRGCFRTREDRPLFQLYGYLSSSQPESWDDLPAVRPENSLISESPLPIHRWLCCLQHFWNIIPFERSNLTSELKKYMLLPVCLKVKIHNKKCVLLHGSTASEIIIHIHTEIHVVDLIYILWTTGLSFTTMFLPV